MVISLSLAEFVFISYYIRNFVSNLYFSPQSIYSSPLDKEVSIPREFPEVSSPLLTSIIIIVIIIIIIIIIIITHCKVM